LKATLFDEGLYPAAKIFLAWKSPPQGTLLRPDLELYSPPIEEPIIKEVLTEETTPEDRTTPTPKASTAPSKPRGDTPKWFMMGKK